MGGMLKLKKKRNGYGHSVHVGFLWWIRSELREKKELLFLLTTTSAQITQEIKVFNVLYKGKGFVKIQCLFYIYLS